MKISIKTAVTATLSAVLMAMGAVSCKTEYLDPVPQTALSNQVIFSTPTRIIAQVYNMYDYVKSGNFYGGRYLVYNDVRVDDFINRTSNGVTAYLVWNHTLNETSTNDVINLWGAAYAAINQVNVFLAGLEANTANYVAPTFPADFATTTVPQYQGEARMLRALCYYSLLQLYARPYADGAGGRPGLPLRLRAEQDATGNDLARSTVAEVYTQILADLDFAEQNLPATYGAGSASNLVRAHRNTAIALKTRVYLTMGQYANVEREANKIVSASAPFTTIGNNGGVAHALNSSVVEVFVPGTTAENIFSFPFTAQDVPGGQSALAAYYLPTTPTTSSSRGNGEFFLNTNGVLASSGFSSTDARRTNFVRTVAGNPYLFKFTTGTPYTDNVPVIRYAEVLLNLSEALFRINGPTNARALALLNAVRTRSNGTAYTGFASADAAINAVLLERRIEFIGEGLRNIDIMRQNIAIPAKGTVSAVPPSQSNYVWPIPQSEIVTNSLITRNQ